MDIVLADFPGQGARRLLVGAVVDDRLAAGGDNLPHGGGADAARAAGYQNHFASKIDHRLSSLCKIL